MAESDEIILVKSVFLSAFIVFSVIGNGLVLYAIYKYKDLRVIPNYFVLNLAVTDILFAISGMTMILITTVNRGWLLGDVMCDITGLSNTLLCTVSIWTLVMISVNRLYATHRPFQFNMIFNRRRTRVIIASVWLLSLLVSSPPLFGWSKFTAGDNYCTINGKHGASYTVVLVTINYIIPTVLLVLIYVSIYRKIRGSHCKANISGNRNAKQYELVKMFFVVVMAFFVCWSPFIAASVLYSFNITVSGFHMITFGTMFGCLNSVVNPFIYGIFNKRFRKAFCLILRNTRPCGSSKQATLSVI